MGRREPAEWLRDGRASGVIRYPRAVIRSNVRALLRRSGEFRSATDSDEARRLTRLWDVRWTGAEPIGHELPARYPQRSIRFHTLPGSKQYADNDQEYAEILRRHRVLLEDLSGASGSEGLVVIAADYERRDSASGWSRRRLPGAWPWRRHDHPEDHVPFFFWVTSRLDWNELAVLLRCAADEEADLVISNADLDWLYHPYDGGADVVLPTTGARDNLHRRHAEWLPVKLGNNEGAGFRGLQL